MQSVTGDFLFGAAGRVRLGLQPSVRLGCNFQALEVVEFDSHGSGSRRLVAKVVGELLHMLDTRVSRPAPPRPLLEGEVRDAGLGSDFIERLAATPETSHHIIKHWFFGHLRNLAIYDYERKSQVASHIRYAEKMRKEDQQNARAVLAANVKTLIAKAGSQPALVRVIKVPQKTISRAKNDTNAANLDTVNDIARGAGLQPWQLLVPDLDPDNPPSLVQQNEKSITQGESSGVQPSALDRLHKRGGSVQPRIGTPKPRAKEIKNKA